MKKTIIFDVDGTLVDASSSVAESWTISLRSLGYDRVITTSMMRSVMGLTMDDIGKKLFPDIPLAPRREILQKCMDEEIDYLRIHPGELFPQEEKTLKELVENGYKLAIVSNAQKGYIEAFLFGHPSIQGLFFDHACWGDNELPKGMNIKALKERNKIEEAIYVGDTIMDEEASLLAEVPFVYASYGYGSSKNNVFTLKAFSDLLEAAPIVLP